MNWLEDAGGRLCGTDFLFAHALDPVPTDLSPLEALARTVLADPMVGSMRQRAERVRDDARRFGAEALLVSRIPGASHCAREGSVLAEMARSELGVPVAEIEVPPVSDALRPTITTRLEALVEAAREARRKGRAG